MQVLYILHSTQATGGATKAILGLALQLKEKNVTPTFLVPDRMGIYNTLFNSGHQTYCIPFKLSIYPNYRSIGDKIFFFPKLLCRQIINIIALVRIIRLVKALRPDIIHTNTSVVSLGRMAAKWVGIPHIQHIREYGEYGNKDFSMHYFPSWKLVHRALEKDNLFNICITKDIQSHHGLKDLANTIVIYDGVHDSVQKMPAHEKEPFFLFAGRIEHIKGVDLLLNAYKQYADKNAAPYTLYIAGGVSDSLYYAEQKTFIDQNHLTEKVVFLGDVKDIENFMQKAKALVIPSRAEGFGFCMPEAMFNGCLCIGNNTAGTKEQIENGLELTGKDIALTYTTEEELADCLQKVHHSDESQWENMKKRAFRTVNTLYTNEESASAIFKIYKNITQH